MSPENVVPSTSRPVRLEVRSDLVCEPSVWQENEFWIVKDPLTLSYYRLRPEQYTLLGLLDGKRSLEELRDEFLRRFPGQRLRTRDLQRLVVDLHQKGLVVSNETGQAEPLAERERERRRKAFWQATRSLLYIKLPGWDPESVLRGGYPWVRWALHPLAILVGCLFVVSSWTMLLVHFDEFQQRLPDFGAFLSWSNLLPLWLLMGATKVLHELGHGYACKHQGGECHEIGVAFLVFSPALYCDVSDSWTLPSRTKRMAVGAAGMYVELVISAVAFYAWWFSRPGMLHNLSLNVFFVTSLTTILFNLNPLLRYDGYYLLCDWLEIPNLRPKADKATRNWFAEHALGLEQPRDPTMPDRGLGWFVLYAIAAAAYRWFIVFGIVLLLHRILKPYGLQSLGLLLGLASVGTMVFGMGLAFQRILSAPRRNPVNVRRLAFSLLLFGGAGWAVFQVPMPRRLEVPVVLEPAGIRHVYANTDATLARVHVAYGDRIRAGEPLVDLDELEFHDRSAQLESARASKAVEVAAFRAMGDTANEAVALASHGSLDERFREFERRKRQLRVVAPIDGTIVAPPERSTKPETSNQRLPRWSGTPLEPRNQGAQLAARTHLLSIAPNDEFEVVAFVEQQKRPDFDVGQAVRIRLPHLPNHVFDGRIVAISPRHLEDVPSHLSRRHGGDLETSQNGPGGERLETATYRAVIEFDPANAPNPSLLRAGLRGHARITVSHRTAAEWVWRYVCETFHFRM